jgi:hypothetical protein
LGLNPKPLKKKVITKTQTSKKLEALFSKKNKPAMALQGLKRRELQTAGVKREKSPLRKEINATRPA